MYRPQKPQESELERAGKREGNKARNEAGKREGNKARNKAGKREGNKVRGEAGKRARKRVGKGTLSYSLSGLSQAGNRKSHFRKIIPAPEAVTF